MQLKPSGWPAQGPIETVPEVFLRLSGSAWPPASSDAPAGTAPVGEWSIDRSLTGGNLPGQVRGPSGFSIATGSATFAQPQSGPLSPWGRGGYSLSPGGACELFASHDGATSLNALVLGRFLVAPISGSNVSNSVTLDLEEDSIRMRRPFTVNWTYDADTPTFDAAWVLRQIAAQSGYQQTNIENTGSLLRGIFDIAGRDAWSVAQEIAAATMGAVWISEQGVFTYRNRDSLRGTGFVTESVEALDSLESLEWTIDPGDIADRVEYTYTPTDVSATRDLTTLWEASEPIRVAAGATVTIRAEINGTTDRLSNFLPIWDVTSAGDDGRRMSRWAAAVSADGGGAQPSSNALRVVASLVSPTRASIRVTNRSSDTLWLVDGNGNPCLILRTSLHITPGEPVTIASGQPEAKAINTLAIDAGAWVQDAATAQQMLGWVSGQTTNAQAVVGPVRVKPDLARQLGDVIRLTDEATNLRTKAVISGIHLSGDASGYLQTLDLSLLDIAFADFDAWLDTSNIITFADFDQWLQANDIVTFAQFDDWLIDFGGTL